MKSIRSAVLYSLACLCTLASITPSAEADSGRGVTAITDRGPIRGAQTAAGSQFLGIPYAAAPTGALRFRPPQPHASWRTPRAADAFGDACPQINPFTGSYQGAEDCLFLNVYSPDTNPARDGHRYPVMVWFHGGSLESGTGAGYDPTTFVAKGVVVVTPNYRLGALGFLAHPALTRESPDAASGNYGLMDQQQALRWVRANIAHFSGDPRNVTIFGQSAGGLSVFSQLTSPLAAGLFQGAIVQSGSYALAQPSLATAEAQGQSFATAVGCSGQDATCLRSVPAATVVAKQGMPLIGHLPNLDGKVLPRTTWSALQSGDFNRVPVIVGSTHDEMTLYIALDIELVSGPLSADAYAPAIATGLQVPAAVAASIVAQYPSANYVSPGAALAAVTTDALFACTARSAAQLLAQYVPVFAYEFDDPDAPYTLPNVSFPYGAYHGADLQYLFSDFVGSSPTPFDPDQARLSETMIRYWAQFARTANPNALGTPIWHRYDPSRDTLQLLVPPRPESYSGFSADHKCAFWAAFGG